MSTPSVSPSPVSPRQRWAIGLAGVLVLTVIVIWMVRNSFIQLALIAGVVAFALELVFLAVLLRNGIRWLFSRRGLVFVGWVVAGLASLIVLFYAEENWRGKRAWAAVLREAAARGESAEFSSVFPPPVNDENNFLRAPGVSNLLAGPDWRKLIGTPTHNWPITTWASGYFTDLLQWQTVLQGEGKKVIAKRPPPQGPCEPRVAADVLGALKPYDVHFQALRQAAERPGHRFDIDYRQGMFAIPHWPANPYEQVAGSAELLCVRASAQLVLNRPGEALEDVLLALRLANCLAQEPFWEGHARQGPQLMHVLQVVWEGLATRRWTEPQLLSLEKRLGELDLLDGLRWRLRADALVMMNLADQFEAWQANRPSSLGDNLYGHHFWERFMASLVRQFYPAGWLYQDKAWLYRLYLEEVPRPGSAPQAWAQGLRLDGRLHNVTDPFLLVFVVPRVQELYHDGRQTTLFVNAGIREAVLACALERYWRANSRYPATLQELVPAFLNRLSDDPLATTGTAYQYRPAEKGYALYSIGLNLVDDGGKPSPDSLDWQGLPQLFPRVEQGDWVWSQPPAE